MLTILLTWSPAGRLGLAAACARAHPAAAWGAVCGKLCAGLCRTRARACITVCCRHCADTVHSSGGGGRDCIPVHDGCTHVLVTTGRLRGCVPGVFGVGVGLPPILRSQRFVFCAVVVSGRWLAAACCCAAAFTTACRFPRSLFQGGAIAHAGLPGSYMLCYCYDLCRTYPVVAGLWTGARSIGAGSITGGLVVCGRGDGDGSEVRPAP